MRLLTSKYTVHVIAETNSEFVCRAETTHNANVQDVFPVATWPPVSFSNPLACMVACLQGLPMKILSPEASETYHSHTVLKGLPGEGSWPIHSLAVVIRAPAGTVDVHMLWVVADRLRFHHVCDIAVQHPHTCKAEMSKLVTRLQQTIPKHATQMTSGNKEYI